MKILLIIDETFFFHPDYVDNLIQACSKLNYSINVGIVNKIPRKNNINTIFIKFFYYFSLRELFLLGVSFIYRKIMNLIFYKGFLKKNFSVKGVCKKNNVFFFSIENDINLNCYISKINSIEPDIVLSSNSLYFGKKLLSLDGILFINRHTSLLPAYGGLWPVIRAINNYEKLIGVTIHLMSSKIDDGKIIEQESFELNGEKNLFVIYEKAFKLSLAITLRAIKSVGEKNIKFIANNYEKSYFGMPGKKEIKKFKKLGGTII